MKIFKSLFIVILCALFLFAGAQAEAASWRDPGAGLGANTFTGDQTINGDLTLFGDINIGSATIEQDNATHAPIYSSGLTGLDDISSSGLYTLSGSAIFQVKVDSTGTPDNFVWRKGSVGAYSSAAAMTGSAQLMQDGISVTWAATTGHTLDDTWEIHVGEEVHINSTYHVESDLFVTGDLVVEGNSRSLSPFKLLDGLKFINDITGDPDFHLYVSGSDSAITPLPSAFDGTLIFKTHVGENQYDMDIAFWDAINNRPSFVINQGGIGKGTVIERGVMIGAQLGAKALDGNYTLGTTEFPKLAFDTSTTGADLGVENDVQVKGSLFVDVINESTIGVGLTIGGNTFINDTANTEMTTGLTINQGDADDEILAFKSSDVGHSMEDITESDTYGLIEKGYPLQGGLSIRGFTDADNTGLMMQGIIGADNHADTTPAVVVMGQKFNATMGVADLGNAETILAIQNGSSVKFAVLGDGSVGIGTDSPDSVLHIKANTRGTVGSHPAGQIIIQNPADDVTAGAVITGYESDGSGNPDQQLWYLGSSSSGNEDIILLNRRNAALHLSTNGSTRVTLSSAGNVGIAGTSSFGGIMTNTANTTDGIIQFTGTGYGLWVDTPLTGYSNTACWQSSSGNYLGHCSSSKRYKDNITNIPYGLDAVMKLRPVEFDWNNREESVHDVGLIAEEVARVIPEIIGYDDDRKVDGLNYRHLTAVLVKAVQEQQAQIDELRRMHNGS